MVAMTGVFAQEMPVIKLSELTEKSAKVRIVITNFGEETLVELPMVYERGDWYIDNFVTFGEYGYDEKLGMKEYISY